jgi:methionyl-tRNA formyltransferase
MTRIVFLGTPEAAVPTLATLSREFDVGLVITQPDRPRGRSGTPTPPAVKMFALDAELKFAQPSTSAELVSAIEDAGKFDVGVVVAYGRILDPPVLALPAAGIVNLHFSLLPRWRGAAPVERALMAGDSMTGVTVIKIDEGLDTGPVLTAQAVDISPDENGGELTGRLANLGGRLIVTVLAAYMSGSVAPVAQSDEGAIYATKISADDRVLANSSSVTDFVNRVRALAPSPAATIEIDGQAHKIFKARPHDHAPDDGTWVVVDSVPVLGVGGAGVELVLLQPSGKTPRSGEDWVRGRRTEAGVFS